VRGTGAEGERPDLSLGEKKGDVGVDGERPREIEKPFTDFGVDLAGVIGSSTVDGCLCRIGDHELMNGTADLRAEVGVAGFESPFFELSEHESIAIGS
jgi:hypothetical protein